MNGTVAAQDLQEAPDMDGVTSVAACEGSSVEEHIGAGRDARGVTTRTKHWSWTRRARGHPWRNTLELDATCEGSSVKASVFL